MLEKTSPWAIVKELTEDQADRRIKDGAVDVFPIGGKSFRTFAYGDNIQNGREMRSRGLPENFALLSDPESVGPLVEHFNDCLRSTMGNLNDHLAAENAHLREDIRLS
jgi:hypothetical protein